MTKSESTEIFYRRCEENDLKITPQRIAIYQELLKAKDHPSADTMYKRLMKKFPNISLDTVNRTLLTFHKIGIASIVEGYGQPKRFDPEISTHHHFRCVRCNRIVDFHEEDYDNLIVPHEIQKQFTVFKKRVILEGLCDQCKKKV
jgi:Fur family peroxide stress response transcriptional regulator